MRQAVRLSVLLAAASLLQSTPPRVLAQEMPEWLRAHFDEHFIGEWDYTVESDGTTVEGTFTVEWSPQRYCVYFVDQGAGPDGPRHASAIISWHGDTETIVHQSTSSDGGHFQIVYRDVAEGDLEWRGEESGFSLMGGNANSYEGLASVAEWGDGELVYRNGALEMRARRSDSDEDWEAAEWEKLVGSWRAEHPWDDLYRIKRITRGKEVLEIYSKEGELVQKQQKDLSLRHAEGLNFFSISNQRVVHPVEYEIEGSNTFLYKVHDGRWYEAMSGIFANPTREPPTLFLVYDRVPEAQDEGDQ